MRVWRVADHVAWQMVAVRAAAPGGGSEWAAREAPGRVLLVVDPLVPRHDQKVWPLGGVCGFRSP